MAEQYATACGKGLVRLRCPDAACMSACLLEASCDAITGRDDQGAAQIAACFQGCDGVASGPSSSVGVGGASSGPSSATGAGPASSSASSGPSGSSSGSSTGSGGGHDPGCVAYIENMCAVCNSFCDPSSAREDALNTCDTFYPECKANIDCQAQAPTCTAAGQCAPC